MINKKIQSWIVDVEEDGTITLPSEVVKALHVSPGDNIMLILQNGRVYLESEAKHNERVAVTKKL